MLICVCRKILSCFAYCQPFIIYLERSARVKHHPISKIYSPKQVIPKTPKKTPTLPTERRINMLRKMHMQTLSNSWTRQKFQESHVFCLRGNAHDWEDVQSKVDEPRQENPNTNTIPQKSPAFKWRESQYCRSAASLPANHTSESLETIKGQIFGGW